MTGFKDIEFDCIIDDSKTCNDCDECVLCYKCVFLQERKDDLVIVCDLKGQVDIHCTCHLYRNDGDVE